MRVLLKLPLGSSLKKVRTVENSELNLSIYGQYTNKIERVSYACMTRSENRPPKSEGCPVPVGPCVCC